MKRTMNWQVESYQHPHRGRVYYPIAYLSDEQFDALNPKILRKIDTYLNSDRVNYNVLCDSEVECLALIAYLDHNVSPLDKTSGIVLL